MINKVILFLFFNYGNPDSSMLMIQNFTKDFKFLVIDSSRLLDKNFILIESDVKFAHNFKSNNKIKISGSKKTDTVLVAPLSTSLFFIRVNSFKKNYWHDMIYYSGFVENHNQVFSRSNNEYYPIKGPIYVLAKEKFSFNGLKAFFDNNFLNFKTE